MPLNLLRYKLSVLILLVCSLHISAQTLSVESFKLLPNDMTANTYGTMERDQNGDVAALIKMVTSETGFVFDGGMMGIVKSEQKTGEVWIYVPYGLQKITISHQQLGVLRDYYFPVSIEKARTYELKLVSGRVRTIIEDEQTTQFLVLKVDPPTASVYLDGRIQSLKNDGSVSVLVDIGKHEYRVEAAGYITQAGSVQVGREKVTKEITLKSSKGELTLFVDNPDAEIWLNGEIKGYGKWTGMVDPGKYVAEARLEHHRTRSIAFDVDEQEVKNVTLTPPEPMYGFIQFSTDPVETTIFMDGKVVGMTPFILRDVLEGEHTVRFEKKGYHTYETTVVVEEGKRSEVSGSLSDFFTASISSSPKGATVKIDGKSIGVTPIVREMSTGNYQISVQKSGYRTFNENVRLDAADSTLHVRLPREFFKNTGLYAAGKVNVISPVGASMDKAFALGCYLSGVNLEVSYNTGYDSSYDIGVYFVGGSGQASSKYVIYHIKNQIAAKTGYGIRIGNRFRITPQAGVSILSIKSNNNSESFVLSAVADLSLEMALVNHVSLSLAPQYYFPLMRGPLLESITSVSNNALKLGNGLGVSAGLSLYF